MLISSTVLDDLSAELDRECERSRQHNGSAWLGLARAKAIVDSKRHEVGAKEWRARIARGVVASNGN